MSVSVASSSAAAPMASPQIVKQEPPETAQAEDVDMEQSLEHPSASTPPYVLDRKRSQKIEPGSDEDDDGCRQMVEEICKEILVSKSSGDAVSLRLAFLVILAFVQCKMIQTCALDFAGRLSSSRRIG